MIFYAKDPRLVVFIDRTNRAAPVTFQYVVFDDTQMQPTPFQTADMPDDDQEAAEKINQYAESLTG